MGESDGEKRKNKVEEILEKAGDTCVACGEEVVEDINLYKRGRKEVEVWENIDIICNSCFEYISTGSSELQTRKNVQDIISEIEDEEDSLDRDEFSIKLIKKTGED